MADNVTLPGTGEVTATKEIDGKHHQRMLITAGDDGSYLVAGQAAMAASLPVVIASDQPALAVGPDFHSVILRASTVSGAGDIDVSTAIYTGYAAPTTVFFDGADAGFDGNARYIRIPMAVAGWRDCEMVFQNQLGVACQFTVIGMATWETNYLAQYVIYSESVSNAGATAIAPYVIGMGGVVWVAVPALANPHAYLIVSIDPASDPSSGWFSLAIARRS